MKPPSPGDGLTWREFDVFDPDQCERERQALKGEWEDKWHNEIFPSLIEAGYSEADVERAHASMLIRFAFLWWQTLDHARKALAH
jgi:hypothetical protein